MRPGEVRGVARKFAVFVALRNAGRRQQSFRTRLQTAVTAGDSAIRTVADCFPTRPFTQRTNLDRGLHTEVTVLTVHPGSEFVQGQMLAPLCTSCGVDEGAVDGGGKNGTEESRPAWPTTSIDTSSREIGAPERLSRQSPRNPCRAL